MIRNLIRWLSGGRDAYADMFQPRAHDLSHFAIPKEIGDDEHLYLPLTPQMEVPPEPPRTRTIAFVRDWWDDPDFFPIYRREETWYPPHGASSGGWLIEPGPQNVFGDELEVRLA